MLTFLGYTLAVIIGLAVIPTSIAIGTYVFKEGIPSALVFIKSKLENRNKDSLDLEIESAKERVQWLEERDNKFKRLAELKEKELRITERHREYEKLLKED